MRCPRSRLARRTVRGRIRRFQKSLERVSVKHVEKGLQGVFQNPGQNGGSRYRVRASLLRKALCRSKILVKGPEYPAQVDLTRWPRQFQAASLASVRRDEAILAELMNRLDEMPLGNAIGIGNFLGRAAPLAVEAEIDEDSQRIAAMSCHEPMTDPVRWHDRAVR